MIDWKEKLDKNDKDYRGYFRKNCYLPIIEDQGTSKPIGSVINLSTSGLFIETDNVKNQKDQLKAKFFIPGTSGPIDFLGEVVHIKNQESFPLRGMGIRFVEVENGARKTLINFVLNHRFNEVLKNFQKESLSLNENLKPFNDDRAIHSIFESAVIQKATIKIFWSQKYTPILTCLNEVGKYHLSLKVLDLTADIKIKKYDHLYLELRWQKLSYFFEASVKAIANDFLIINIPDAVYFEERRVEVRRSSAYKVELPISYNDGGMLVKEVLDLNSSGFSFDLPIASTGLSPGEVIQQIQFIKDNKVEQAKNAKIIHITQVEENKFKIGVEFLTDRQPCQFKKIEFHKKEEKPALVRFLTTFGKNSYFLFQKISKHLLKLSPQVHVIKYPNSKGEEITAILNATFDLNKRDIRRSVPIVIIPPAFARRKETTGLLALTLIEMFKQNKKDIVVVRFDGIRSVGESFNDKECCSAGEEMVNHTLSQLIDDIHTTINHIGNNTDFTPSSMVIVSFSMASVAARRVIAEDQGKNVKYWISCMGASDPDDLMKNSTGGLDYLKRFEGKEKLAIKEVLGHKINLDQYCNDIISNNIAYLEDARSDMNKVTIPVTWIYGRYDYWINKNRILDIMSIQSEGLREVYEVPAGHIAKTSLEAINIFKMVGQSIWKQLHNTEIAGCTPSLNQQVMLQEAEWNRVKQPVFNPRDYWRSYLLGNDQGEIGFDLITLTDEYQQLMRSQLELLDLKETDVLLDIGAGTGNFIQYYLENLKRQNLNNRYDHPKIFMVDFIYEALLKARDKHRKYISLNAEESKFRYLQANLECIEKTLSLPFRANAADKILASLFLSYLKNPEVTLTESFRVLKPGGMLILSSLKPDTDMSKPIDGLLNKIKSTNDLLYFQDQTREELLKAVQLYINSAAYLTDLEEMKLFKFYNSQELKSLLINSGFKKIQFHESFGNPTQGLIAVAFK